MHKHPALTLGRLKNLHRYAVKDQIIEATVPVTAHFIDHPSSTEAEARQQKSTPVTAGFQYGPAYRVFWFLVNGQIPQEWNGKEVALRADVGGERTVWVKNSPERGIDGKHALYRLSDSATGGEAVDLAIQVYTGNPSCRVHVAELPREPLVETVGACELVCVNSDLQALDYDLEFALSLLETISETDPSYAVLLRGLNAAANQFESSGPSHASKIIRDTLRLLPGELRHTVYPVGHAHLDTAWLWPIEITKLKMAHTTANQLYLMDRYPGYVFAHSQASQYEWLEKEYPDLLNRVKAKASEKQWEPVGGMWVEADCNLTGSESLIRQFLYGRRWFKKHFGFTTDDMWLPDVFGYAAALPQILNKFGIQTFLTQKISWNQFNKFPHNTFWWQGIDGTRIWTHFPPADTYIGDCTPKQIIESVHKHKDHARSDHSLYLFGWGDGGGGPTETHLELLKRGAQASLTPSIETGKRAIDFFREAKRKSKDLAVWTGELYLEMHRGTYTSQAANKKHNRECEFLLRDAEWLATFRIANQGKYPSAELEEAWKLVLLNQFHDIIPGSSVREVYEDSEVDYAKVRETVNAVITAALQETVHAFDISDLKDPMAIFVNADVPTQASIPWSADREPTHMVVGDRQVPVQLCTEFGDQKLILETPEEAMGTVAVVGFGSESSAQTRTRLKVRDRRIENDSWSVRLDAQGNITSITSLDDSQTQFIEQGALANVFQIFEDFPNFWSAWDVDLFSYETGKDLLSCDSVEIVERGPVRAAIEVTRSFGSSTLKQRISLGPTPGIRFDTWVDWHETNKLLKVAFPLNVNAMRATYEIQFGHVERPTHYNTSWDMAKFEVPAQKWVDVSQGDIGVALLNDCKYGFDCHQNVLRMSLLRSPKAPDPMCDMGVHRFSYVLLPHFGSFQEADVVAAAYALNSPLRAAPLSHKGHQPRAQMPKLISVDTRNVVIESVKKAEDSSHVVVRLYECHNTRGRATLNCVLPIRSAWLCDLNEENLDELEVVDGQVEIAVKPFEIVTLKLAL